MDIEELKTKVNQLQDRKTDLTAQLAEVNNRLQEEEAARGQSLLEGEEVTNDGTISDLKSRRAGLQTALTQLQNQLNPLVQEFSKLSQAAELARIRKEFIERAHVLSDELHTGLKEIENGLTRIRGTQAEIFGFIQRPELAEYRGPVNELVNVLRYWMGQEDTAEKLKLQRCFEYLDLLATHLPADSTEEAQAETVP